MLHHCRHLAKVGFIAAWVCLTVDVSLAPAQQIPPGGFNDACVDLSLDAVFKLLRRFEAGQSRQPINFIEHEVYRATADPMVVVEPVRMSV